MNINLILSEELLRSHNLMGIKPKILLEALGGKTPFDDFVGGYASILVTKLQQFLSEQNGPTVRVFDSAFERTEVQDAIDILKDNDFASAFNSATKNAKKLILLQLQNDETASKYAYLKLVDHLIGKGSFENEQQLLTKVQQKLQERPKLEVVDSFESLYPRDWNNLILIAKNTIESQYNKFVQNPNTFIPIKQELNPSQGVGRSITKDSWAWNMAQRALREVNPKKFNSDYFNALRKSNNQIKKEIQDLVDGYFDRLKSLQSPEQKKELAEIYAVQITRRLNQIEAKTNGVAIEILKSKKLPKNVTDIIETDPREFFTLYRETWGIGPEKTLLDEFFKLNLQFGKDLQDTFVRTNNENKISFFNSIIKVFDPRTKIGQFMFTDSFAAFDRQWQLVIRQSGFESGRVSRYIASMMWISLCGYVIASFLTDFFETLLDLSLFRWLNKYLPLDVGFEGKEPWFTIDRFPTEDTETLRDIFGSNFTVILVGTFGSIIKDTWEEFSSEESGIAKKFGQGFRRMVPFGLFNFSESVVGNITEWALGISMNTPFEAVWEGIGKIINATPPAEVVAYEDNEDSCENWFKDNYPDQKNNIRRCIRNDDDPQDIYYEVKMKGTQTTDYYFKYDSQNQTFKPYE